MFSSSRPKPVGLRWFLHVLLEQLRSLEFNACTLTVGALITLVLSLNLFIYANRDALSRAAAQTYDLKPVSATHQPSSSALSWHAPSPVTQAQASALHTLPAEPPHPLSLRHDLHVQSTRSGEAATTSTLPTPLPSSSPAPGSPPPPRPTAPSSLEPTTHPSRHNTAAPAAASPPAHSKRDLSAAPAAVGRQGRGGGSAANTDKIHTSQSRVNPGSQAPGRPTITPPPQRYI
jgi:hypothetical protein